MKSFVLYLVVVASAFCAPMATGETNQASGLKLIVHEGYTIAGRCVKVGDPEPEGPVVICEISIYLKNCGDTPLTVPTYPEAGQPSAISGSNDDSLLFLFSMKKADGICIIESPIKFQPVTLQPGQTTQLPTHRVAVRDAKQDFYSVHRSVVFEVRADLAEANGWWSGSIRASVTDREPSPNKALVPTPASVTPAAGAPVAPDAGAAHL
jgi:hypothetical protein